MGKLRKEGLDLWGVWEDKPSKEYPFPHPDLDYFEINIIEDREVPSSVANSQVPISEPVGSSGELPSSAQEMAGGRQIEGPSLTLPEAPQEGSPRLLDPNALNPYEPITFEPWINALDDDGFRTRDLIRELREAPEFGLHGNRFYYDRSFVERQERVFNSIFCKWIVFARLIPNWNQGVYLEMGRGIIQTLRDAYCRARRVDVDLVHQKMEKDVRPEDKFYHHVSDQLVERQQLYARVQSFSTSGTQVSRPNPVPFRQTGPLQRRNLLCFFCC